ncbi:MAG: hypothetical protein OHK93_004598 [Ramalina farinacea]|uniref:Uncharacterized protein n=1 Tax=Ramalina farinacea TaxID=258253 RepID=A0AA43QYW1_9LECA|nr:hypothetical protein [Ramalina farinacea]
MSHPSRAFPDEVTLKINKNGETVIGNSAISRQLREEFMAKYKKGDCRQLAFLSKHTATGTSFAEEMAKIAKCTKDWRRLPDKVDPDRACPRRFRVGYDSRGAYSYELERSRHHAPQISALKHENIGTSKDRGADGQAQQHASSGHHTGHEKQRQPTFGVHGEYKWG